MSSTIVIASDHGGFELKATLMAHLQATGHNVVDLGCPDTSPVDYPTYAHQLCERVKRSQDKLMGVLVCGTGLGMSMAANRHPGIRAALCTCGFTARMAREHNNANVLCLGGRVVGPALATDILDIFLSTPFGGDRHQRRIDQIELTHP